MKTIAPQMLKTPSNTSSERGIYWRGSCALTLLIMILSLILLGCKDDPVDTCPGLKTGSGSPYNSPIWHPMATFIGFNHVPLTRIELSYNGQCLTYVNYVTKNDSDGFWLVDSNSNNMTRSFNHELSNPNWSSDGQWIAFDLRAQIFKVRFSAPLIDLTTITQLTTQGSNFNPSWSPDDQWILFDKSLADSSGLSGVWIMKPDGSNKQRLFGGAFPTWFPDGNSVLGVIGSSPTSIWTKFVRYYLSQNHVNDTISAIVGNMNLNPMISPDGNKIAFWSRSASGVPQIWIMNVDGTNITQITSEGVGERFSWSPDSHKLVYVSYIYNDWTYSNGVLWTKDLLTGVRKQLTFNPTGSE